MECIWGHRHAQKHDLKELLGANVDLGGVGEEVALENKKKRSVFF